MIGLSRMTDVPAAAISRKATSLVRAAKAPGEHRTSNLSSTFRSINRDFGTGPVPFKAYVSRAVPDISSADLADPATHIEYGVEASSDGVNWRVVVRHVYRAADGIKTQLFPCSWGGTVIASKGISNLQYRGFVHNLGTNSPSVGLVMEAD